MICKDEVFKIGKFVKPHGIKGEISLLVNNSDLFDQIDCPFLICDIDGIFVPFFIKEFRFKGLDTVLVTLEDVATDAQAKRFSGLDVYFPRKYVEEKDDAVFSIDYFMGFTVIDKDMGNIGVIIDIDTTTINTLFLLEKEEKKLIIPASEDFLISIDEKKKILHINLPQGLID